MMGSAGGLTAAGLKGLRAAAERHVGDEKVPGLVALVARGGQVHVEALARLVFGWDGGLGTSWLVDPSEDLTMIVLTQPMFETPDPPRVHRDIQAAAYAALA